MRLGAALSVCLPLFAVSQTPVTDTTAKESLGFALQPWDSPQERIVVMDRIDLDTNYQLYVTRSSDGGATWTTPSPALATGVYESHGSLIQTGEDAYQLFYSTMSDDGMRISRATSANAANFTVEGPLELGWAEPGSIRPRAVRLPGGRIVLVYDRLLDMPAYVSWSDDDGASWDTSKVQIAPAGAQFARITWREADDRFLLTYSTGAQDGSSRLWARTTTEIDDWSDPATEISSGDGDFLSTPLALDDGDFAVLWGQSVGSDVQLFSSHSENGNDWSEARQHTFTNGSTNVAPFGLDAGEGCVDLFWTLSDSEVYYDIVQELACLDPLFGDQFE
ncbi:sialidase family protein [Wenzhouxiangella sediminis]|uniref:Exo-alpha-sialidase n=1 Tax=Wenzhouxiangella sediminis TaxID=1792836 RepID=A0A3E1KAI4_9GAMM|nr:sialidase family protein [Wenzhouxiangella sediminis]RFF31198.1 exo-alpha-sialidase [Wenzhouxiangella sediminis]